MCEKENHTQRKRKEKLALPIEKELKLFVQIAERRSKNNHQKQKDIKESSVIKDATRNLEKQSSYLKNSMPIEAFARKGNQGGFILKDTENHIRKEFHILRREDMQERKMPKVHIHLKNGRTLSRNLITSVLIAKKAKSLLKTISFLYQKMEQIIFQTFNHCVVVVIAANGKSFNIYENPGLLK